MKHVILALLLVSFIAPVWAASFSIENVIWTAPVNVSVSGNSVTCISGNSTWNAGAFSTQYIAAGFDGYVEMTAQEVNSHRMFGLSDVNTNAVYSSIDYAVYLVYGGAVYVYENGNGYSMGRTYTTGDIFRVSREGAYIKYYQNGVVFRTVSALSSNLYADISLYENGSTIYNAKITMIPEPTSMILLLLGLFGLVAKKLK